MLKSFQEGKKKNLWHATRGNGRKIVLLSFANTDGASNTHSGSCLAFVLGSTTVGAFIYVTLDILIPGRDTSVIPFGRLCGACVTESINQSTNVPRRQEEKPWMTLSWRKTGVHFNNCWRRVFGDTGDGKGEFNLQIRFLWARGEVKWSASSCPNQDSHTKISFFFFFFFKLSGQGKGTGAHHNQKRSNRDVRIKMRARLTVTLGTQCRAAWKVFLSLKCVDEQFSCWMTKRPLDDLVYQFSQLRSAEVQRFADWNYCHHQWKCLAVAGILVTCHFAFFVKLINVVIENLYHL